MRLSIAALVLLVFGPLSANAIEPDAPPLLIERPDAVAILIQAELEKRAASGSSSQFKARLRELLEFYKTRQGAPVWLTEAGWNPKRAQASAAFERAGSFGLNAEDYKAPGEIDLSGPFPAERLAHAEVEMSLAAVLYAVHAQSGRFVPQDISEYLDPRIDTPSAERVLQGAASSDDITEHLESFHPQNPQFRALKAELAKIVSGSPADVVVPVPARGPTLKPGDTHPDVAALRQRLGAPKPADGAGDGFYDEVLADVVKAFQSRSGLTPDAVVGPSTRAAFATPPAPDRDTLIANMERWRWAARDFGETHVRVNIPEFLVRVIKDERTIFEERIVVGKPENKTPVFSDEMETVVFNPFWNVPGSITTKEILPMVRRNPSYLERNNLQVFIGGRRKPVDPYYVDWETINPNQVFIRQPPGADNALGKLKFLFPNKHAVYMHDTPTKHLFNQGSRAFSHGCVRVRNPRNFAEVLLRAQGWTLPRIEKTIASGVGDVNVQLTPKIPVHILYFTLWAREDGSVQRFRDIYGHDARVLEALRSARS